MKFKEWKFLGRASFDRDSLFKTIVRESENSIPSKYAKRKFPQFRLIVTNQHNFVHTHNADVRYEVYMEDGEYNLKTSYGSGIGTLEAAKFIGDLKLIELGHEVEALFIIGDYKND
jgi:hypothetical protein